MPNSSWMDHHHQILRTRAELAPRWKKLREEIKAYIEQEAGTAFSDSELGIGASLELDSIRFDFFYETDDELEQDRISGRRDRLSRIMHKAGKEIADANTSVHFHSHQTVREKCGGDYFRYFR